MLKALIRIIVSRIKYAPLYDYSDFTELIKDTSHKW